MKDKDIRVFDYKGKPITFDIDGQMMVNATEMAKAFGKRLDNFMRLKSTKEFMGVLDQEIKADTSQVREREIVKTIRGGRPDLQGTWFDYKLAIDLAAWLSPHFKSWMYDRIMELMQTGTTSIDRGSVFSKELQQYEKDQFRAYLLAILRRLDD